MEPIVLGGTDQKPSKMELENRALARKAAAESFVLIQNDGTLPLKEKTLALYGSGARMTVKGGTGSGAVRERHSVSIAEGLLNAGYTISTTNWLDRFDKFYADTYEAYRQGVEEKVKGITSFYQMLGMAGQFRHPTGIPVEAQDYEADREAGVTTAIYVLARQAGEGADRKDEQGDYRLDDVEIENLRTVRAQYEKLIVVINAGGVIDVSFLDEFDVNALIYFVQGGEEGGNAIADCLSGKADFSGRLATGWAYDFADIPSNTTYSYLGKDKFVQEYNEGIYVGYRFFDTFGKKPRFPFGYGLSYTTFSLAFKSFHQNNANLEVRAEVKNSGSVSGREVAELYATVPFGKTGAEYQRLVAFAKTKELAPGEMEEVTLSFPVQALTKYDEEKSAFVLEKGDYILRLGESSDNTCPVQVLTLSEDFITEYCKKLCAPKAKIEEIVPPERKAEDLSSVPALKLSTEGLKSVHHEYPALPVYDEKTEKWKKMAESLTDEELATLLCGGTTEVKNPEVLAMGASGSTTAALYSSCGISNIILSDGPAGLNLTPRITKKTDGTWAASRVPENTEAYKRYLFGIAGKALLARMADPSEGEEHYQYCTAWPCSELLAQSFNTSLLEEVGDAVGKEMEAYGVSVWLAPGMNIHRNPLCGRTFEYYSEDPLVSGLMAAALVRGVQSHSGKGVSVKHYNKINGVYCTNNYDLLVDILRNEWGFDGLVMSDWDAMKADREDPLKPASSDVLKAASAQCDLVMPGREDQIKALTEGLKQGLVKREDALRSAARVLTLISQNTVLPISQGKA